MYTSKKMLHAKYHADYMINNCNNSFAIFQKTNFDISSSFLRHKIPSKLHLIINNLLGMSFKDFL